MISKLDRLLKNALLRRSPHPSSLQRTFKYASLLRISGALHLGIFDQPEKDGFSNRLSNFDANPNPPDDKRPCSNVKPEHNYLKSLSFKPSPPLTETVLASPAEQVGWKAHK